MSDELDEFLNSFAERNRPIEGTVLVPFTEGRRHGDRGAYALFSRERQVMVGVDWDGRISYATGPGEAEWWHAEDWIR
jgi:hypothetical protein